MGKPYMIISLISTRGIAEALRSEFCQANSSTSSWFLRRSNMGWTNSSHEACLLLVHVFLKNIPAMKIILLTQT